MVYLQPKHFRKYLRSCDSDAVLVLCECFNILLGHVTIKIRYCAKLQTLIGKRSQEKFIAG